jgi:hypothetical protein
VYKVKLISSKGTKKPKKKMQFSKKIALFAMILVTWTVVGDQILVWFGKEPLGETARAVISLFGGFVVTGQFALEGVRDTSLNRHKIHIDGEDKHFIEPPTGGAE